MTLPYRELAGNHCSLIGFGCMRFPMNKNKEIDEPRAEKMLDEAMRAGVNYFDTAYNYHGGKSESFVGKTLKKYQRDRFFVATKLPLWKVESQQDAEAIFNEQLSRLNLGYIDYYLFHAMNAGSVEKLKKLGLVSLAERWKKEGKIRHIGFSFHDSFEVFSDIINFYPWDFCQIQYNYLDTENQAGDRGLALAASKSIPVIVMEPIRGGSLVHYPDDIKNAFSLLNPSRNLANFALSWVGTHENVKVILSGMSTITQVRDNLKTFRHFEPLSDEEMRGVSEIAKMIRSRVRNGCTGCRYCMPCPFGVDIPRAFYFSNEEAMHKNTPVYRRAYLRANGETYASKCHACGSCEKKCPQHLSIIEDLKTVSALFES